VVAGKPVYVPGGTFEDIHLPLPLTEPLPEKTYFLRVFGTDAPENVGIPELRDIAADVGALALSGAEVGCPEECRPCCTFADTVDPVDPDARFYAQLEMSIQGLTGVRSRIETQWPTLCGDPDDDDLPGAISAAWLAAVPAPPASWMWATAGYAFERTSNGIVREEVYFEVEGSGYHLAVWTWESIDFQPPLESQILEYKLELNDCCGDWYFSIDSTILYYFEDEAWDTVGTAAAAVFAGEIDHFENDMPGRLENPVDMDFCEGQVGTGTDFMSLDWFGYPDTIFTTDTAQWGIEYESGKVSLWDKCPLP